VHAEAMPFAIMKNHLNGKFLQSASTLRRIIQKNVGAAGLADDLSDISLQALNHVSVVLVVLSDCKDSRGRAEPCLILNKRSTKVRQAGDLCYPGGGLSWRMDRLLGRLLNLPLSPLKRWSEWPRWSARNRARGRMLSILLAAGLREAWEEMRLNPLRLSFLGVLPKQHLVMFKRVIYPMVGWVPVQALKPNWEVDRIVKIPLRKLLDPTHYGRFRPMVTSTDGKGRTHQLRLEDFPCFIHEDELGRELLWGATYRITQNFLERVFDFQAPPTERLPLAHRHLDGAYLNGSRWNPQAAKRDDDADW
jgi:8-oxo-dGTP pyrophosphatase MutT (NUDIX family)